MQEQSQNQNNVRLIDRLGEYARFRNLNDARVTRDCQLAIGTLGKSRKPGKDLTRRVAEVILSTYSDLSRDWFLNGEGEMIQPRSEIDFPTYPLIDTLKAECGRPGGLSEAAMEADCPIIGIPGVPRDTDFFVQASGYSMVNSERPELSIPPGSMVGVSKMKDRRFVRWGEVYLLSTVDGFLIKRLLQDEDSDYVRCASYNKSDFPEFRLPVNEIIECGRITCVVPVYVR